MRGFTLTPRTPSTASMALARNSASSIERRLPLRQRMRPWQTVCMEYDRVGLVPPANMPRFRTAEDAEIWMCLDSRYNHRLRETTFGWQQAV